MRPSFSWSWAGTYRYNHSGFMPQPTPAVAFQMSISLGWFGRFSGKITEDDHGVPETALVQGRVRGTRISFRKWYPSFWMASESGENIRVPGLKPFVLYYRGDVTHDFAQVNGVWEIPAESRYINEQEWEFPAAAGTWDAAAQNKQ
ncbi:hypothetical protein [Allorhodopirellula solitaria]|uniref:Uncharacterized protein n=1 Tax=Allorhodopirellula solitaria TaxID=2527987 RepID=A0A5C5WMC5_9BACT|nr:hypothetical protein [Allorhodopirellula solitaria]TWT51777.1 hypothetical protein CA85_52030 [Allorhodopirellula solitaria]